MKEIGSGWAEGYLVMSDGQGNLHGVVTFEQDLGVGERNHRNLRRISLEGERTACAMGLGQKGARSV